MHTDLMNKMTFLGALNLGKPESAIEFHWRFKVGLVKEKHESWGWFLDVGSREPRCEAKPPKRLFGGFVNSLLGTLGAPSSGRSAILGQWCWLMSRAGFWWGFCVSGTWPTASASLRWRTWCWWAESRTPCVSSLTSSLCTTTCVALSEAPWGWRANPRTRRPRGCLCNRVMIPLPPRVAFGCESAFGLCPVAALPVTHG